ncbi:MAG: SDR family oxidoreductase [Patescibacteria group bacterium]|jgi:short-subunit dehydrogenase
MKPKKPFNQTKTILITGASSGIGQAIAYRFAKANHRLVLTYHQNQAGIQETAAQSKNLGASGVVAVSLDLGDDSSIQSCFQEIKTNFPQIDILINNSGFLVGKKLVDSSFAEIDNQFSTNLVGLIKFTKMILPSLTESVVNIGSNLGLIGKGKLAVYSASKFGVRGFSQSLAKEYPNLRVYTVNPPLTATRMGSQSGLAPAQVAEVVFRAGSGLYRAKSGSDINVSDYLFGEFLKYFIAPLRAIKRKIL